jgi:HK97 family phage major capsid protein
MGQEVLDLTREVRDLNRVKYLANGAADFIELTRIHLMATSGDHLGIARLRNTSTRVLDLLGKGAVAPMATTDPGANALLAQLAEAFLQSISLFSSFDTILNAGGFMRVPLRTRLFAVTLAGNAYMVSEADAKPVSKISLASSELQYWKTVGIAVLTDELVRSISSAAADFINNEIARAVGYTTDQAFTELLAATTGAPSTPSTGTTAANFLSDVEAALSLISFGATSRLYLIVPSALNRRLITMRDSGGYVVTGGAINSSIRVVCSDALTDSAIMVDASQIAAASDTLAVTNSRASALMLDDNPTSPPQLVSLFQNNLVAAKAERYVGCEVLREDCLCLITGVSTTA